MTQHGLHGEDEIEAFRALPPFPASDVGEICRHVLMGVMPALIEHDLPAFGAAVTAIQMLIGTYFAPAQGGVFTSKRVEAAGPQPGRGGRRRHRPEFLGSDRLCLRAVGDDAATEWSARSGGRSDRASTIRIVRAGIPARRSARPGWTSSAAEFGRAAASAKQKGENMARKHILHMLTPLKHMSPFDVNMALDAGFDAVIPYVGVSLGDVTGLVQDAIFSRPPDAGVDTGIFIAGKDVSLALDMFDAAKKAMVPPFQVSVFADPAGSFTTAAAMVAKVEKALDKKFERGLKDTRIAIFGATGVVGFCTAVIAAREGAEVTHRRP